MIRVEFSYGGHQFVKENTVTRKNRKGLYDLYRCSCCGLEGKSYLLGTIDVYEKDKNKLNCCINRLDKKYIQITLCTACGPQFKNLLPASKHTIISPPEGYDRKRGEWVMGVGEPVLVLFGEFIYI